MKGLFDIVTIVVGLVALTGIVLSSEPLTAENASLQTAKAAIAIAFVVTPYFIARAIEKVSQDSSVKSFVQTWSHKFGRVQQVQPAQEETPYFDYLFMPGSSRDWKSVSTNLFSMRDTQGDDTSTDRTEI